MLHIEVIKNGLPYDPNNTIEKTIVEYIKSYFQEHLAPYEHEIYTCNGKVILDLDTSAVHVTNASSTLTEKLNKLKYQP